MHSLLKTLKDAALSFLYEDEEKTKGGPHIRDAHNIKRMMMIVVFALLPCTITAILNTGVQTYVMMSFDADRFIEYTKASETITGYIRFVTIHFWPILWEGAKLFIPALFFVYASGGLVEAIFATIHKKPITEGFLVTGLLITLIIPSTLPYWMIIVGTSIGLTLGKGLFGGTGMNILNPALVCRCFLFFTFPAYMSGEVWVGTSSFKVKKSILEMTQKTSSPYLTSQSSLSISSPAPYVKKLHTDTIRIQRGSNLKSKPEIEKILNKYDPSLKLESLTDRQLMDFVTSPSGLLLNKEFYNQAYAFAVLQDGEGNWSNANLFFGNQIGSMGETSTFAVLLGAILLIYTGVASWRIMLAIIIGTLSTAFCFQLGSNLAPYGGLYLPAHYSLLAYRHFLYGSLAFGLVFMATDPVSSPSMSKAQWAYGILIGLMTIVIRMVNPAFSEGVMLAILFGNVFAPLFDRIAINQMVNKGARRG